MELVTAEVIKSFITSERRQGLSEASLARMTVALRTFHRFAARELGILDASKEIKPPKLPRRLPKALSIAEMQALVDAVGVGPSSLRDCAIIETLYATGARVSELVALNVSDVRDSEAESFVIRLLGKGGKERIVPIGSYAKRAISDYLVRLRPTLASDLREPALFLNNRGDRMTRQSMWAVVLNAAKRAGLEGAVSPHSLRHSFATHLLDGGADIRVVQELLGHAAVTTTQIYTMVTIDKLRESYITAHPRAR